MAIDFNDLVSTIDAVLQDPNATPTAVATAVSEFYDPELTELSEGLTERQNKINAIKEAPATSGLMNLAGLLENL
jgi:hypothetical protein